MSSLSYSEKRRYEFSDLLKKVTGITTTYYQPPESIKMVYPCIVYEKARPFVAKANDHAYLTMQAYDVQVICKDPDNTYAEKLLDAFSYASFGSRFVSDNLYHDNLTIYY